MIALPSLYTRVTNRLGLGAKKRYPLPANQLFPIDLIVHLSYHKCLTYYYTRVMKRLRKEFGVHYRSCASDAELFNAQALTVAGKRILMLSDSDAVAWTKLPPYKGSHFIRDPRDLIVSGYHYHLWTKEAWTRTPNFGWQHFIAMPAFQYIEPDPAKYPTTQSYQEYLNSLDPESGMLLELLWRTSHFEQMQRWNYRNPNILEMRYEDIVGNERAAFECLFTHYGFHPRLRERALEVVDEFSIKNQPRGERDHLRNGEARQWDTEFTPRVRDLFKQRYPELLVQLGYERSANW